MIETLHASNRANSSTAAYIASTSLLLLLPSTLCCLHAGVILPGRPCTASTTQPTCRAEQQACSIRCRTGRPYRRRFQPGLLQQQPQLQPSEQQSSSGSPAPRKRYGDCHWTASGVPEAPQSRATPIPTVAAITDQASLSLIMMAPSCAVPRCQCLTSSSSPGMLSHTPWQQCPAAALAKSSRQLCRQRRSRHGARCRCPQVSNARGCSSRRLRSV